MKLLTKKLLQQLPLLYTEEDLGEDAIVHVHFFNPLGVGDWWITDGSSEGDDFIMFGLCDLGFPELGYVSLNELESVRVIERDLYWVAKSLRDERPDRCGSAHCSDRALPRSDLLGILPSPGMGIATPPLPIEPGLQREKRTPRRAKGMAARLATCMACTKVSLSAARAIGSPATARNLSGEGRALPTTPVPERIREPTTAPTKAMPKL